MTKALVLLRDELETPIGRMVLATDEEGRLRVADWQDYTDRMMKLLRLHYGDRVELKPAANPNGVTVALRAYFEGELHALDGLETATAGTAFQRQVWATLRTIPCGRTISYGALAVQIGQPKAIRAVGLANGANPIGVVVPCHRVIGANGSLTGYGGGLHRKRWLLAHETAAAPAVSPAPNEKVGEFPRLL